MFNLQDTIDAAIKQAVDEALAKDATADAAQIDAIRAEAAQQIQAALAADAAQDAAVLKANADEIARLNGLVTAGNATIAQLQARIAVLEAGQQPPVEPPPPPPPPPPPVTEFNPRNMSVAQIAAATGIQVDAATLKKSAGVTISKPGTYENMDYTGRVTIETTGKVLFRNCRFNGGGDYYAVFNVPEKFLSQEIRLEFCELRNAVNCIAGANLYVYRCDISEWENGVNFWGAGQVIETYIHDQKQIGSEPHFDGTECNGGGNIKILRSYVANSAGQTSALMFNNEFGALHDIEIDGCYLAGGGYTVYFDTSKKAGSPTTNIRVTNNTLKKGTYGHTALYNSGVKIDASGGNVLA